MNLFDQVSNDIKSAMLAKDKVRLEALRGIKKEFLEAKTAKGADGELTDDMAMKILAKMVKQRKESAQIYTEQNRPDLAEPELAGSCCHRNLFAEADERGRVDRSVESDYRSGRSYYSARDGKGDGSSYQTVGRACRWPRYFCESKRTVGLIQNKYLN